MASYCRKSVLSFCQYLIAKRTVQNCALNDRMLLRVNPFTRAISLPRNFHVSISLSNSQRKKHVLQTATPKGDVKNKFEHNEEENQDLTMKNLATMVGKQLHPQENETVERKNVTSKLLRRINQISKKTNDSLHLTMLQNTQQPEQTVKHSEGDSVPYYGSTSPRTEQETEQGSLNIFPATNDPPPPLPITVIKSKKDLPEDTSSMTPNDWYDHFLAKELEKMSSAMPVQNAYDQQILLTEEGKMWKFPVDNEQGMESEQNVPFHAHVFLHDRLEDWCPKEGPIRLFMNAVVASLSNSPYYTVEEKHEHIDWFRSYFVEKLSVLKKIGVVSQSEEMQRKQEKENEC